MSEAQEVSCAKGNGFMSLGAYLMESWHIGKGKVNLWAYWLVGIVGIGGLGVWVSIVISVRKWHVQDVMLSLITCAIPIIVSACLDFIFDQEKRRFLLGFAITIAFIVVVLDVVSLIISQLVVVAYSLALISMAMAYCMWWIANARNPKLDNACDYSTPIGSIDGDVSGPKGGFTL